MLFEIRSLPSDPTVRNKVQWIKECREQTGLGLRESKDIVDFAIANLNAYNPALLDTHRYPQFSYIEKCRRIVSGQCTLVRMVNRGSFMREDQEVDQILTKIGAKINKPSKSADAMLKQTAISLIRGNYIRQAKGVLDILM